MIKVLGSGSKGNCYLVQAEGEKLLLECGLTKQEILKGLNFDLNGLFGCLITHEHKDHCKAINEVEKWTNTFASEGTYNAIGEGREYRRTVIKSHETFKVGGFTIVPFSTEHDCLEPLGFLIHHPAIGKILFATDTFYLKYKFKEVDHFLIECNHSRELIKEDDRNARLFKSHMSIEVLKDFLVNSDLTITKDITLIHLSNSNSNADLFKKEIEKLTGKTVYIAEKDLIIETKEA